MDKALVIGASGGIGSAVATELEAQGARVRRLSRSADGMDLTDEDSIRRVLSDVRGSFDLIFISSGVLEPLGLPPEKALKDLTPEALTAAFQVNAAGPILAIKHCLPLLPRDRPATIAVLSARVGSIGDNRLGGWHSYRASKAALNQLLRGAAIELARTHRAATLIGLHPGTVATEFTRKYAGRHKTTPPDEAARNLLDVIARLTPEDSGRFLDYAGKEIPW